MSNIFYVIGDASVVIADVERKLMRKLLGGSISGSISGSVVHYDSTSGLEWLISQVQDRAIGGSPIKYLHLYTDGNAGALRLGNFTLTADNIDEHREALETLGGALAGSAEIYLYGSSIAANEEGKAFVNKLSRYSGAVVAASSDSSGVIAGHDGDLEFRTGKLQGEIYAVPHVDLTFRFRVDVESGRSEFSAGEFAVELHGGEENEKLNGSPKNDKIYGGAGSDSLYGHAGADTLFGDIGGDFLYGGGGDDVLRGGDGKDFLYGNDGHDTLHGEDHDDTLYGGVENDVLYGGDGFDTLFGGRGDDDLRGGKGNDELRGGAGDDYLFGGEGHDRLFFDWSDGYIDGGEGLDTLVLTETARPLDLAFLAAADIVAGIEALSLDSMDGQHFLSLPTEVLFSLSGGIVLSDANWFVIRGEENDVVSLLDMPNWQLAEESSRPGFQQYSAILQEFDLFIEDDIEVRQRTKKVAPSRGLIDGRGESLHQFLQGSDKNDTIYGGESGDYLYGAGGNDRLRGEGGNDKLYGDAGADTLDGGEGSDEIYGGANDDLIIVSDFVDIIDGGTGEDTLSISGEFWFDLVSLSGSGQWHNIEHIRFAYVRPGHISSGTLVLSADAIRNFYDFNHSGTKSLTIENGNSVKVILEGREFWQRNDALLPHRYIEYNNGDARLLLTKALPTPTDENFVEVPDGYNKISSYFGESILPGGEENDYILGLRGADVITGGGGDDIIRDARGLNRLSGDKGNDTLIARSHNEFIDGGDDVDVWRVLDKGGLIDLDILAERDVVRDIEKIILPYSGEESVRLRLSADAIKSIRHDNECYGGCEFTVEAHVDTGVWLGDFKDWEVFGQSEKEGYSQFYFSHDNMESGDIELFVSLGVRISSDEFDFVALAGEENSAMDYRSEQKNLWLLGNGGDNRIRGGAGDDTLHGGSGDDTISIVDFADIVDGGADEDSIVVLGDDVLVDLSTLVANEQWQNIEKIGFGVLRAGHMSSGSVILSASAIDDLYGARHAGEKTLTIENVGAVKVILEDREFWQRNNEILPHRYIEYNNGDVSLRLARALPSLDDGNFIEVPRGYNRISGYYGDDALRGGEGNDYILGLLGEDSLYGGGGEDILKGGRQSDELHAGGGNDILLADLQDSLIDGGDGIDVWRVQRRDKHVDLNLLVGEGKIRSVEEIILPERGNNEGGYGTITLSLESLLSVSRVDDSNGISEFTVGGDSDTLVILSDFADWVKAESSAKDGYEQYNTYAAHLFVKADMAVLPSDYEFVGSLRNYDFEAQDGGKKRWVRGDTSNDMLRGGDKSDTIRAGAGNDTVHGGAGNDTIYGGGGNDVLYGERDNDVLRGGGGRDELYGGEGENSFHAGGGADKIYSNAAFRNLNGGKGFDTWYVKNSDESIDLDMLTAHGRISSLEVIDFSENSGEGGELRLSYSSLLSLSGDVRGEDIFFTVSGSVESMSKHEVYLSDAESWSFRGSVSNAGYKEYVNGKAHLLIKDGFSINASAVLNAVRSPLTSSPHKEKKEMSEAIRAKDTGDVLHGGSGDDYLEGGSGKDSLYGHAGRDTIRGGNGDDLLSGGSGTDILYGGRGRDTLHAEDSGDELYGDSGDDYFVTGGVIARIDGGKGEDTWKISSGGLSVSLDLAVELGQISSIERIDLSDGDDEVRQLQLSRQAIGKLSGDTKAKDHSLIIDGDQGDMVWLSDSEDWQIHKHKGHNGYIPYYNRKAHLLIEKGLVVNFGEIPTLVDDGKFYIKLVGDSGDDTLFSDVRDNSYIDGKGGDDRLYALSADIVRGGGGDDIIYASLEMDFIDGGEDTDIWVPSGGMDIDLGALVEANKLRSIEQISLTKASGDAVLRLNLQSVIGLSGDVQDGVSILQINSDTERSIIFTDAEAWQLAESSSRSGYEEYNGDSARVFLSMGGLSDRGYDSRSVSSALDFRSMEGSITRDFFIANSATDLYLDGGKDSDVYIIGAEQRNLVIVADNLGDDLLNFDIGTVISVASVEGESLILNLHAGDASEIVGEVRIENASSYTYSLGHSKTFDDTSGDYASFLAAIGDGEYRVKRHLFTEHSTDDTYSDRVIDASVPLYIDSSSGVGSFILGDKRPLFITDGVGSDSYILTRFQASDVIFDGGYGDNVLIFDVGVRILGVRADGDEHVISIENPAGTRYNIYLDGSAYDYELVYDSENRMDIERFMLRSLFEDQKFLVPFPIDLTDSGDDLVKLVDENDGSFSFSIGRYNANPWQNGDPFFMLDDTENFEVSGQGLVTLIAPFDYESPRDADGDNEYILTVYTDYLSGYFSNSQTYKIVVENVQEAPVVLPQSSAIYVTEGDTVSFDVPHVDDGDSFTHYHMRLRDAGFSFNALGEVEFVAPDNLARNEVFTSTIVVSDGEYLGQQMYSVHALAVSEFYDWHLPFTFAGDLSEADKSMLGGVFSQVQAGVVGVSPWTQESGGEYTVTLADAERRVFRQLVDDGNRVNIDPADFGRIYLDSSALAIEGGFIDLTLSGQIGFETWIGEHDITRHATVRHLGADRYKIQTAHVSFTQEVSYQVQVRYETLEEARQKVYDVGDSIDSVLLIGFDVSAPTNHVGNDGTADILRIGGEAWSDVAFERSVDGFDLLIFAYGEAGDRVSVAEVADYFNGLPVLESVDIKLPNDSRYRLGEETQRDWVRIYLSATDIGSSQGDKVEVLLGSDSGDVLYGSGGRDFLYGGKGHDTLHGDSLADFLRAGDGNDELYGYAGGDRLYGGEGNDTIDGGAGNDTIDGGEDSDVFVVSAGDDSVVGFAIGDDKLDFTRVGIAERSELIILQVNKDTRITLSNNRGSVLLENVNSDDLQDSHFIFRGEGGSVDRMDGARNNDFNSIYINGDGEDNVLIGNSLDNTILGGGGNDVLIGGEGSNRLRGDAGEDTYVIDEGNDVITEFVQGEDRIDLSGLGIYLALTGAGAFGNLFLTRVDVGEGAVLVDIRFYEDPAHREMTGNSGTSFLQVEPVFLLTLVSVVFAEGKTNLEASDFIFAESLTLRGRDDVDDEFRPQVVYSEDWLAMTSPSDGNSEFLRRLYGNGNYILGGGGFDVVDYSSIEDGVRVNLGSALFAGIAPSSARRKIFDGLYIKDNLASIEAVIGSGYNDVIIGSVGDNHLNGGAGNDWLYSRLGDDTLLGGAGSDIFVLDDGHHVITDFDSGEDRIDLSYLGQDFRSGLSKVFVEDQGLKISHSNGSFSLVLTGISDLSLDNHFIYPTGTVGIDFDTTIVNSDDTARPIYSVLDDTIEILTIISDLHYEYSAGEETFLNDRVISGQDYIGDINGDGIGDFLFSGAYSGKIYKIVDGGERETFDRRTIGEVFVVFGEEKEKTSQISSSLSEAIADNGFVISSGERNYSSFGNSIYSGDFNGNGYADLAISDSGNNYPLELRNYVQGSVYVIYDIAKQDSFPKSTAEFGTSGSFIYDPYGAQPQTSYRIRGISFHDMNGDGYDDLIIDETGGIRVIWGAPENLSGSLLVDDFGEGGSIDTFRITDDSNLRRMAHTIADFNGDGVSDFALLQERSNDYFVDVIFGGIGNLGDADLSDISQERSYSIALGEINANYAVMASGDINGDGRDDVLLSALQNGRFIAMHVILGIDISLPAPLSGARNPSGIFSLASSNYSKNRFGEALGMGDFNGDGYDDIFIVTDDYKIMDPDGGKKKLVGAVYVLFGTGDLSDWNSVGKSALDLDTFLDGTNGFIVHGDPMHFAIGEYLAVGDTNNDGYDDILLQGYHDNSNVISKTIYGFGTSTQARHYTATADDEIIVGTNGNDILSAGTFDDVVLRGGNGDDEFRVTSATSAFTIDGGAGHDILVDNGGGDFDFTQGSLLGKIKSVEEIDFESTEASTLTLDLPSLLKLSDNTHDNITTLEVISYREDHIIIADSGWESRRGSDGYAIFTKHGGLLLAESDTRVSITVEFDSSAGNFWSLIEDTVIDFAVIDAIRLKDRNVGASRIDSLSEFGDGFNQGIFSIAQFGDEHFQVIFGDGKALRFIGEQEDSFVGADTNGDHVIDFEEFAVFLGVENIDFI